MGSIRSVKGKHGVHWRAEVYVRGIRESDTFASKTEARQWAIAREAELGKSSAPVKNRTLAEILTRYATDVSPSHKGDRWERIRIAKIMREFPGVNRPVRDLRSDDVVAWREDRLRSVAGPSVAREMGLLFAALAHASREWRWLSREKLDELRGARRPPQSRPRTQRVPSEAQKAILESLGYAEHEPIDTVGKRVALAFLLGLETAMRCGELCGLTPADVELKRRFVRLPVTKNGDAREVPLTVEAVRLFGLLPKAATGESLLGVTPRQVDANFRKARDATKWKTIRFHDTRAEALTNLSSKVDILTLARIAGHRDLRSLSIYYRETAEQIAARL